MEIEILREFIVFSKHLNITKAACELHLSPSTLSRHLSALEKEFGIPLIAHKSTNVALTKGGSIALEHACAISSEYQVLCAHMNSLKHVEFNDIRIDYALDDRQVIDRISLVKKSIKQCLPNVTVKPCHIRGKEMFDALLDRSVDVVVLYDLDAVDVSMCSIIPLMTDSMVIALPLGNPFSGRPDVTLDKVADRKIPWPTASTDNYLQCVLKLFKDSNQQPSIRFVDSDNMDEFFMHDLAEDEMWVFSRKQLENYATNIPASYRQSCEIFEFADVDTTFTRYAVYLNDNENLSVPMFVEALTRSELC
ncbi:MAG: LysR family transcriptional regulator [Actinobacteria bacterium]|nr:LysR family transcriptional regulator [Actinomycetota bacterium]